jgi:hypothetical protein
MFLFHDLNLLCGLFDSTSKYTHPEIQKKRLRLGNIMYLNVKMTDIAEAEPSLLARADVRVPIPGRNTHNFGLVQRSAFWGTFVLEGNTEWFKSGRCNFGNCAEPRGKGLVHAFIDAGHFTVR